MAWSNAALAHSSLKSRESWTTLSRRQRKQTSNETETEAKAEAEAQVKSKTLLRKQFLQTVRQFYSFRVEKENKQTELVRFDLLSTQAQFERISAARVKFINRLHCIVLYLSIVCVLPPVWFVLQDNPKSLSLSLIRLVAKEEEKSKTSQRHPIQISILTKRNDTKRANQLWNQTKSETT